MVFTSEDYRCVVESSDILSASLTGNDHAVYLVQHIMCKVCVHRFVCVFASLK